jgi:hypothetical protein
MSAQSDRRISRREAAAIVVATSTVETATTSTAPVFGLVTLNAPTGGTVKAGGAITGGRIANEGPALGAVDGADVCAGGEPGPGGTVTVVGRDVVCGAGGAVRFGEGFGAGGGVTFGGASPQQCPSPWCSCDHP